MTNLSTLKEILAKRVKDFADGPFTATVADALTAIEALEKEIADARKVLGFTEGTLAKDLQRFKYSKESDLQGAQNGLEISEKFNQRLMDALKTMRKNWDSHTAFGSLQNYAKHSPNCEPTPIACSCGMSQSLETFLAGKAAIDSVISPK